MGREYQTGFNFLGFLLNYATFKKSIIKIEKYFKNILEHLKNITVFTVISGL